MLSASQSDDHSCTFFHKTFLKALIAPHVFGMRATKRQATHSVLLIIDYQYRQSQIAVAKFVIWKETRNNVRRS